MSDAISVAGLVKNFGPTKALDGLDLVVRTGEVHGFLGPNGAGKTTTLRVLLGLLRADAGTVRLLGGDPWAVRWFFVAFIAATFFEVSIGRRIHAISRRDRPRVADNQP